MLGFLKRGIFSQNKPKKIYLRFLEIEKFGRWVRRKKKCSGDRFKLQRRERNVRRKRTKTGAKKNKREAEEIKKLVNTIVV